MKGCCSLALLVLLTALGQVAPAAESPPQRYLYVVCPGIRNYLEFGGAGILVFDIDDGHKFVKRIATPASREEKPDNIKGVCACAATRPALLHHALEAVLPRSAHREDAVGERAAQRHRPHVDHARRQDALRAVVREGHLERDRRRQRQADHRRSRPRAGPTTRSSASTARGCTWRAEVAAAVRRRHEDAQDRAGSRPVRRRDPAVHGQRHADAGLRLRQRLPRLRDRRPDNRQEAAPRRGAGLQAGHGQAARLPEPRHRPDARREGGLGRRCGQPAGPRLRQHGRAAQAEGEHHRPRAARLGHVQPRRQVRLSLDGRGDRHGDARRS